MGEIIRFVPGSERARVRLIREARAIYDSIFPQADPVGEQTAHAGGAHLGKGELLRTGDLGHRTPDAADVIDREAATDWGGIARV